MKEAKIRLSPEEKELITNADWILTKNNLLHKVTLLLANLQVHQQEYLNNKVIELPHQVINSAPKISKGENYKGLPYRVLDFPKYFDQSAVLAIRTMFWWGNFFSTTLHVSGLFKKKLEEKIIDSYTVLRQNEMFYCINTDEWEHHFEASNYIPVSQSDQDSFSISIRESSFIKLAKQHPIEMWDDIPKALLSDFKLLINIAGGNN